MITFIQNTYLKFKNLFSKSEPKNNKKTSERILTEIASILDRHNYHGPEVTDQHLIDQLNEWQKLSGITDWKNRVIRQKAVDTIYKEEIEKTMDEMKFDQRGMDRLKSIATIAAERMIEAKERADYYGIAMEKKTQEVFDEIAKIEDEWKKYFKKSGNKKETADLFAEFLVKNKFLTKKQLATMSVSAVFIAGKIKNPLHFHQEMKNARYKTRLEIAE